MNCFGCCAKATEEGDNTSAASTGSGRRGSNTGNGVQMVGIPNDNGAGDLAGGPSSAALEDQSAAAPVDKDARPVVTIPLDQPEEGTFVSKVVLEVNQPELVPVAVAAVGDTQDDAKVDGEIVAPKTEEEAAKAVPEKSKEKDNIAEKDEDELIEYMV